MNESQTSRPFVPRGAAGWAGYFLTVFSLLLPGFLLVLCQLGSSIHDSDSQLTRFVILLIVLLIAFFTTLGLTWLLTRRFPVRGATALVVSLFLLFRVVFLILQTP